MVLVVQWCTIATASSSSVPRSVRSVVQCNPRARYNRDRQLRLCAPMFKWKIVEPKRRGKCKEKKTSGKKQPHKTERNRNITQRRRALGKQAIRGGDRCCVGNGTEHKRSFKFCCPSPRDSLALRSRTPVCVCVERQRLSWTRFTNFLSSGPWRVCRGAATGEETKSARKLTHARTLLHTKDLVNTSRREPAEAVV